MVRSRRNIRTLWTRDEDRGAIGVMLALAMAVLLGSAALAIDLGHLMKVRTESQRVADLAALAGAGAFINAPGPGVQTAAEQWAIDYAALNDVDNANVSLVPADIQVDVPNSRVTVTVEHTQARGNAIPTIFARVLGINQVDVVTTAVAEAWPATGVTCLLPFFLVDRWQENGGNPQQYDVGTDYYEAWDPSAPSPTATGYTQADVGLRVILRPSSGSTPGQPNPSWYYPFDAAHIPGASNYKAAIEGCLNPEFVYFLGQLLDVETGAMVGPTRTGFDNLIAQDPNAVWDDDPNVNCIVDASQLGSGDKGNCRSSPRLRPVAMMDPNTTPGPGKSIPVPISNFAGVFVERVEGSGNKLNVVVRYAGYTGVNPAGGGPGGPVIPNLLNLRLVQ